MGLVMNKAAKLMIWMVILGLSASISCRRAAVVTPEVIAFTKPAVTLDANDKVWDDLSVHVSKLILQDLVDPRLMTPSTQEIQVKAITNGSEIAFRLEWLDDSQNDLPGPHHFMDGCAVQVPVVIDKNVPAPQMGETGKSVQISYWRSDWQAIMDGRADNIASLYPNSAPDHYPFDAKSLEKDPNAQKNMALRYAPARALGNRREGPRDTPVEDLIAEGPGTLSPNPQPFSNGKGVKTKTGWAVVITRPVPAGLSTAAPSQIAFAVWEGSHDEVGARKMRTGWVPLMIK